MEYMLSFSKFIRSCGYFRYYLWTFPKSSRELMSQPNHLAPALTHMGIFTDKPEAMQEFYERVLGMVVSDSGSGMLFRRRIIFMTGDPHQHHQFVLVVREDGDPPG